MTVECLDLTTVSSNVFSDFQKHLHGLLKTWVKHWAGQEHDMYKKLKILKNTSPVTYIVT